MLWQTWHRELGGGERLGSGGGIWTRRSCGRGSRSGDQSRLWAAAAGMARAGPAWLLLLLAIWVRLWHGGSVPGHVRPGCGSVLPAPGPSWTCGKMPPAAGGWGHACQAGGSPAAAGEAAGQPPCPPGEALRGARAGGSSGLWAISGRALATRAQLCGGASQAVRPPA